MSALLDAPAHAAYTGGDPEVGFRELRHVIEHHIKTQPRSLQKRIGPSEVAQDCPHCLCARLAGWEKRDYNGAAWLPWIGSCVHQGLETAVIKYENDTNAIHTGGRRYLVEHPVTVGTVGGEEISGHTDLVDLALGICLDFKIVGANTLRAAKAGPSAQYLGQVNLYARGLIAAGYRIEHVAIAYLPRNAVSLDTAVWWHAPHDPALADAVLERANRYHANLTALEEALGAQARDEWITSLPRAEHCWDCGRYKDAPARTTTTGHTLPAPGDPFAID